ncbi:hypothetical protein M2475_000583 [Breznakia sp. PF5-3]|uniref:hypothetical protein n=1 Tax=unclassified Breznakia TaxID=2623764 RepID=UPI002405A458|nr:MULTISPECIES: hypothetical protein [unclassified Breznakia]MDF9824225.1 hypothetical protein [Breznakia sp. PM6-1]MDF9835023.1 hypothetical protein [Breznakia sp. PF5-3]MDF9837268.1 hypothetical protein [Breznakia sp. PFB2-8]MDF9859258.1 hypothetical protein [Breznakia sp. PH5-24]
MKHCKWMLALLSLTFIITGCFNSRNSEKSMEIDAETVIEKTVNRETFLLLIVNDDCDPCEDLMSLIKVPLAKNQITLYRLNYADVSNDMADQLQLMLTSYSSWPALVYVKDGEVYSGSVYEYSLDPEGWETWLINQGLIPQN